MFNNDDKSSVKHRIREWLLNLLRLNKIEKTQYRNILKDTLRRHGLHYPNGLSWEEPASMYWSRDSRSSFGTVADDYPNSSTFGSRMSFHSTKNPGPNVAPFRRRQSTRTRPDEDLVATEALILDTNDPSEAEIDHPSFFPLPRSPSQETDQCSEMDDPSYFPLPPSLSSSLTADNLSGIIHAESQPVQRIDVSSPSRPTKASRHSTSPSYGDKFGTYMETVIPVKSWRCSKSDVR